ncbi:MAG: class I SAM-dependent DNA methyltransferase [Hyphomicrobium sp.]|nr:class I SAM-dependent DNA methyltransferase [Hyphomicrobium sp.]
MITTADTPPIQEFIKRWAASSGAERANFQMFAMELCRLLEVPPPHPSKGEDAELNDYCFERGVQFKEHDGTTAAGRIDLYKRGAFVMEAKQSREKGRPKELKLAGQPDLFVPDYKPRGERSANRAWDQFMISARHQAQEYARALPTSHGWPPFVLVCDVGHCIEVYADFSGQGKNYAQFPDRQGFRIYLKDLEDPKIRERLKLIWQNPTALDPARQSAKVTREIAARLAEVSKGLEKRGHNAEDVALFLMRCLFTMFAEDVELLPADSFQGLLEEAARDANQFVPMVEQLWTAMDKGDFAYALRKQVKRFNGKLFKNAKALELRREEIGELAAAAKYNWKEVEPAIFGTLLEQALNEKERARLGAHYTPRAYVERLVVVTVMEPLRQEWAQVQATAERLKEEGKQKEAIAVVSGYHEKLCNTRVLDPACGTGNFLYVSMELMKRLEGEVLEALADLGGQEALALDKHSVDPHQFLGLELNPRAAAIAELVIWLGYLQWHFRTKGGVPNEPILRDFQNIKVMDAVMTWDGYPLPKIERRDGQSVETYPNAKRPPWPEAEYIVGNPPFTGGKDVRASLGDAYTEALWRVHDHINDSADFVMYWWDHAAEIVANGGTTQRFGFVTTNSITQTFSRRVVASRLESKKPVSLVMAIPDHPWTKAAPDAAAVRIAMTVARKGSHAGVLREVISESALDTDQPNIELSTRIGRINADLTVGVDVTTCQALTANEGLSSPGVKLHGAGFIVTRVEAAALGLGKRQGLESHIRHYRNGRDLASVPRGVMVIDLFGLDADEARKQYPEVYQHVLQTVKPERDRNNRASYRDNWWVFGEPRKDLRPALAGLARYIATVETSKHRFFQFLDDAILPDNKLIAIATDDPLIFGILSSRQHVIWSLRAGGWLGVGNDSVYVKTRCFDPFPFPDCSGEPKSRIRAIAEELDAHRKARQAEHPRLTMTQMYNVLEKLRANEPLTADDERIKQEGLVLILKELHEKLDAEVFKAYGWPATLSDEEILERLVALNKQRAEEEKAGKVKWLRPDYQIPRFGSDVERTRLEEERRRARDEERAAARQGALELEDDLQEMKPKFPTGNELAETAAVMGVLASATDAITIEQIARIFSQGKQIEKRVALTILALARLGHLSSTDNGETFMLRRVA